MRLEQYPDEIKDLRSKCERLEAQCAEMRSLIERYGAMGPTQDEIVKVLSTDCGKAIVERLKEARRLIEHSICRPEHDQRRDQWLKRQP